MNAIFLLDWWAWSLVDILIDADHLVIPTAFWQTLCFVSNSGQRLITHWIGVGPAVHSSNAHCDVGQCCESCGF